MWAAEIVEANGSSQSYFIKGPMFTLGRNEGVDLGFANEKSISRKHCEISISGSGSSLVVKDLNSRFGTFINDRRLVPGETVTCKESEKMVVKLGVASWKLVLSKRSYKFCSTRLEKSERERLKKLCKILGAENLQSLEGVTHLITTKATATVKFLSALVVPTMKIVNLSWLDFAESNNPIQLITNEDSCFPEIPEDIQLHDFKAARSSLFKQLHVFLYNESDAQYEEMLIHCGASVTRLYENSKTGSLDWKEILRNAQSLTSKHNSNSSKDTCCWEDKFICMFFDENTFSAESNVKPLAAACMEANKSLYYINAATIAACVLELKAPDLYTEFPVEVTSQVLPISITTLSVMNGKAPTTASLFEEMKEITDVSSMVKEEKQQVKVKVMNDKIAVKPEEVSEEAVETKNNEKNKKTPAPKRATRGRGKKAVVDDDDQEEKEEEKEEEKVDLLTVDEAFLTIPRGAPESSAVTATAAAKRKRNSDWLNDSDDEKDEGSSMLFSASTKTKRAKVTSSPSDFPAHALSAPSAASSGSSSSSANVISMPINTSSKVMLEAEKTLSTANSSNGASSEGKTTTSSATTSTTTAAATTATTVIKAHTPTIIIDADEWITIDKQMKGIEIGMVAGLVKEGGQGGEEEFKRGETIVVVKSLLDENNMNASNTNSQSLSSSSISSHKGSDGSSNNGEYSGVKNVKKFMKNSVRKVGSMERVSLRSIGVKVAPKQSEREVQLRLEFEQSKVHEMVADAMFADNFGATGNKKGKRKGT